MTVRILIAAVVVTLLVPLHALAADDHLKCYTTKDPVKLDAVVDLTSPQFGLAAGCRVKPARLFCVPATKTVITAADRSTGQPITPLPIAGPNPGDRICYKVKCPDLPADTQVTDQFGTRTLTKLKPSLLCTPAIEGSGSSFVDNGDGTITDHETGLQWEKKNGAGGGADFANPHDVDNGYAWSISGTPAPDGPAFTDFLAKLNDCGSADGDTVTGGFAGHCDWRLPTIAELATILVAPFPCGISPCIDPIFGPALAYPTWSSVTLSFAPADGWGIDFNSGFVGFGYKGQLFAVRAVRRAS